MSLQLDDLHKRYGATHAVRGVSLSVAEGRTLALLGPSGCGKSTLLRLTAGLERPDHGRVSYGAKDVTTDPPQRRRFGVVFQDFALFPHLDVAGNVGFGLVEQGVRGAERRRRVAELLELVGLSGYEGRRVHQLSGGQQQRVALARALAPAPRVLLLDEPLSNLDESLRNELKEQIVRLLADLASEAIYVTHDQAEAFAVADAVAVMRDGLIVQVGSREQLLERPVDAWTARFLGHDNVWEGQEARLLAQRLAAAGEASLKLDLGEALLLRADLVELADRAGSVATTVTRVEREGLGWSLTLAVPAWETTLQWRGHTRELPRDGADRTAGPERAGTRAGAGYLEPGAGVALVVPREAWQVVAAEGAPLR